MFIELNKLNSFNFKNLRSITKKKGIFEKLNLSKIQKKIFLNNIAQNTLI